MNLARFAWAVVAGIAADVAGTSPAALAAKRGGPGRCNTPGCVVHDPPTDAEIDAAIAANSYTPRRGA